MEERQHRALLPLVLGSVVVLALACAPSRKPSSSSGLFVAPSASASVDPASLGLVPRTLSSSPFSPILAQDGSPFREPIHVSLVSGATLFHLPAGKKTKIGRLVGEKILWGDLSLKGLPKQSSWEGFVGRYPDYLWLKISNGSGSDWYRWQPKSGFWAADPRRAQPKRVDAQVYPWGPKSLLLVRTDPGLGGEICRLEDLTAPFTTKPPKLMRDAPLLVGTTATGDIVAVYTSPGLVLVHPPKAAPIPYSLEDYPGFQPSSIVVRGADDIIISGTSGASPLILTIHDHRLTKLEIPMVQPITEMVSTSDGLWVLEARGGITRRDLDGGWTTIPVPPSTRVVDLRVSPADGRLWLVTSGAEDSWMTVGTIQEK
ncbi:MAG: hypothetical protein U0165_05475 [Polyangiaceae bacterium]